MATALYGSPIGFMAAEDQANKTGLMQVQAEKLMGELATIPSEIRLRNAQAQKVELESRGVLAEQADANLMAQFEREAIAKRISQRVAATEGRDANVTDAETPGKSMSDPLVQLYQHMVDSGAPSRMLLPLADKVAKIQENEATTGANRALERTRQLEAEAKTADKIGSMAQTALASPEGYAQMRLLATQEGRNLPPAIRQILDSLPQDWNAAKRILKPIADNALSVKDARQLEMQKLKNDQDILTAKASEARARASATLASTRTTLVREQTTNLKKIGGEGTPTQIAASEALTASRLQEMRAKQLVESPYAPLDPSKAVPGRTYTFKDGRVARLVTASDGSPGWQLVPGSKPWKDIPQPRSAEEIRKDLRAVMGAGGGNDEED